MNADGVKKILNGILDAIGKEIEKTFEKLNSDFEKECLRRYLEGKGEDYVIPDDVFARIAAIAEEKSGSAKNVRTVTIDGKKYEEKIISFYESPEFDYSLGNANIFFDENGKAVGLKDCYDFNPAKHRDKKEEDLTNLMKSIESLLKAKEYDIVYGIYKK